VPATATIVRMFDWSRIDDLDGNAAADALVEARREVLAAEAKQFALAAHWADLHGGDGDEQRGPALPGTERVVPIRGGRTGCVDGCPEIEEYAAAELAALLGRSTVSGEQLIADAVAVRHRHPLLWSAIRAAARRCGWQRRSPDGASGRTSTPSRPSGSPPRPRHT
jgi:hypothetical protein